MEFTKELMEKAKACETVEELAALAKENDMALSREEAELFLEDFEEGELTDEELDNVAGGQEGCKPANRYKNVYWENQEEVQFIANIGDIVQGFPPFCEHHTTSVKVVNRAASRTTEREEGHLWFDQYDLQKIPGAKGGFINGWHQRNNIEKP